MSTEAIRQRLKDLGIALPPVAPPVANYIPCTQSGNVLYVSGQLPMKDGAVVKGCLGRDVTVEQGQEAAKLCAIGVLAQVNAFLGGDLGKISRCLKLGGFIAATPDFADHSKVMNGASDLMVGALGDAGKHARFAVGVSSLPLGAVVEVDAVFEVAD